MMDKACLISAILFFIGNTLQFVSYTKREHNIQYNAETWKSLDPQYIQEEWDLTIDRAPMADTMGFIKAMAWFSFCIPVAQVAWILSRAGHRQIGLHALMVMFVMSGSITELVVRLMTIGFSGVSSFVANEFQLEKWLDKYDGNDNIGWRVLEMGRILCLGLTTWVNAFEWLALFIILTAIFLSVRSNPNKECNFGRKWASFGLFIGVLAFVNFFADIFKYSDNFAFQILAFAVSVMNTIIFLPIWLIILGAQMPNVREYFEGGGYKKSEVEGLAVGGLGNEGHFSNEAAEMA